MSGRMSSADLEARRAAQTEFDRPLVLEAGAGTGKTTTLVARVLSWLLGRGWEIEATREPKDSRPDRQPDEIAPDVLKGVSAITFTDAAAAEMASRVAEGLAAVADNRAGQLPGFDISLVRAEAGTDFTERARALLGHLDHLEVRTIHAFCHARLTRHPLELGLHPDFRIDAELREIEEVVRDAVERQTRAAYARGKRTPLLDAAAFGIGPHELAQAVFHFTQEAIPSATFAASPHTRDRLSTTRDDLIALIDEFLDTADGRLHAVTKGPNARRVAETLEQTRANLAELDMESKRAVEDLCAGLDQLWGQSTLLGHLRKWGRAGNFSDSEAKALAERGDQLRPLCRPLASRLRHLSSLDPRRLEICRRAVAPLLEETERQLRARGLTFFSHILLDAKRLFEQHPEVLDEERRRIKQLLVDEFQDTDVVQCSIIRSLAFGDSDESGPGLFVVGDPKQSIYGWRNADLEAYESFVQTVHDHGGATLSLVRNFRSAPVLLDTVERAVRPIMREIAGLQPRFTALQASAETESLTGFRQGQWAPVESWVSWSPHIHEAGSVKTSQIEATEVEADAVARDIRSLHLECDVAWKDFGVLFRATSRLDRFLEAFRRHGVPFVVTGDKQYFRRREVIDAAALVRIIVNPTDGVALLTYLRSPLVGVPDAALIPLWAKRLPEILAGIGTDSAPEGAPEETSSGASSPAEIEPLVREVASSLPRDVPGLSEIRGWEDNLLAAVDTLAHLRRSLVSDPPDRFIERLRRATLLETGEAARFLGQYRTANLERFWRRLQRALIDTDGDVQKVLRSLKRSVSEAHEAEEALPKDAAEDAVQLMTIHKAKGLEFSHIYLVQLDAENRKGEVDATDADRRAGDDSRREYSLFSHATLDFDSLAERRRRIVAAEQVRILYVAMTRARDRLVLVGNWTEPPWKGLGESTPTLLQLLQQGGELPDSIAELASACVRGEGYVDSGGLRWKFPGLMRGDDVPRQRESRLRMPTRAAVLSESQRLMELAVGASQRMARPLFGRAAVSGDQLESGVGSTRGNRGAAMIVGVIVHSALESWDFAADPQQELERQLRRAKRRLAIELPAHDVEEATSRLGEIMQRIRTGRLLARLIDERQLIVARELPVLLPASDDANGPIVGVRGVIDLVLRDRSSNELIVIDYKTDSIESEGEIAGRADHYQPQLATYGEALRQALKLDRAPRAELWFLWPDAMWRSS